MKRTVTLLTVLLSAITLFAQGKTVNKPCELRSFNSLDISHAWNVELKSGPEQSVVLTYSEELEPYIVAEVKGGVLELSVDTEMMNRKLRNSVSHSGFNNGRDSYILEAIVVLPELKSVEASGAVKVQCDGKFESEEFSLDVSGAANIDNLQITASRLHLEASGASKLVIPYANAVYGDIDVSGASSIMIEGDIENVNTDFSGAPSITMSGNYGHFNLDASGACDIRVSGNAKKLVTDASGACNIKARELYSEEVHAGGSGASNITVHPTKNITIDISGATSLRYPQNVSTKIISVSRGCNIDTF